MSSFVFERHFTIPGIDTLDQTTENKIWWSRFEQVFFLPALIDGATRDTNNTPTTTVRGGIAMGKVTTGGKLKQWSPTATDGTQLLFGFLAFDQNMQVQAVDKDRLVGWVMVGGPVKHEKVFKAGADPGDDLDDIMRAQMQGRFIFDDEPIGNTHGGWFQIFPKTTSYTVLATDNNALFTNKGAAGDIEFTLPAPTYGLRYGFFVVADFGVKVTSGTADTMVVFNDASADSVDITTAGQQIGSFLEVVSDGTQWLVLPSTGVTTYTIAT